MITNAEIVFTNAHIEVAFPNKDPKILILDKLNKVLNGEVKSELEFNNSWMDIASLYLFYFKINKIEHLISSRTHLFEDTPTENLIFELMKSVLESNFKIGLFIHALFKGKSS